jgi:hypothetical protein
MAYLLQKPAYNTMITNSSIFSPWQRSEKQSSSYYSVPMPCIEPHCEIQCSVTYDSHENDGIIRRESLTPIQQEHLMIDLGRDTIVQKLINSIPSYKLCQSSLSSNETSVKFYPIAFGFVEQYLPQTISRQVFINNQIQTVDQICLPKKTKDFSDLIPGRMETYKFHFEHEADYRRLYSTAYFAITMKKGGWDCNRHYEIITSGTMPFFDQLHQVGNHTLSLLPKLILHAAQILPGVNRQNLGINHTFFDVNQYQLLLHRLIYYAKHRLTTVKIVEYILKIIQYPITSSSVLYISHGEPDYMKDFMLHGFTKLFGENLHVYQPPSYMYQYPLSRMWTDEQTRNYYGHKLYGFGYGYKLTLKNYMHLYERDRKDFSNLTIVRNNI